MLSGINYGHLIYFAHPLPAPRINNNVVDLDPGCYFREEIVHLFIVIIKKIETPSAGISLDFYLVSDWLIS